jgi:hypothetical protein
LPANCAERLTPRIGTVLHPAVLLEHYTCALPAPWRLNHGVHFSFMFPQLGACSFTHARFVIRGSAHQKDRITIVLTIEQIRKVAQQSGARDISKVDTDIILTFLLQLFHEKNVTDNVAFKAARCCAR